MSADSAGLERLSAENLNQKKIPMVVIDNNPESTELLDAESIPYIIDDATSEDAIIEAA